MIHSVYYQILLLIHKICFPISSHLPILPPNSFQNRSTFGTKKEAPRAPISVYVPPRQHPFAASAKVPSSTQPNTQSPRRGIKVPIPAGRCIGTLGGGHEAEKRDEAAQRACEGQRRLPDIFVRFRISQKPRPWHICAGVGGGYAGLGTGCRLFYPELAVDPVLAVLVLVGGFGQLLVHPLRHAQIYFGYPRVKKDGQLPAGLIVSDVLDFSCVSVWSGEHDGLL